MEDLNKLAIEIEAEKKSLNEVVETIGIFVNRYKDLKELLNGFVETNKYDLSDDFVKIKNTTKEISDNLDNVKKSLSDFNNGYSSNFDELSDKMEKISQEFNQTLSSQKKINKFLSDIDSFMKTISTIDFALLEEHLNKSIEEMADIKNVVNDLEKNTEANNKELKTVTNSINNLVQERDNQNNLLETITKQLMSTNEILNSISKQNNIDTAVLFSLMDEWNENKKKRK